VFVTKNSRKLIREGVELAVGQEEGKVTRIIKISGWKGNGKHQEGPRITSGVSYRGLGARLSACLKQRVGGETFKCTERGGRRVKARLLKGDSFLHASSRNLKKAPIWGGGGGERKRRVRGGRGINLKLGGALHLDFKRGGSN